MASGHVNRSNRPNTWRHRPATRREDFPCQLGAVHTWHSRGLPVEPAEVCLVRQCGSMACCAEPTRLTLALRPLRLIPHDQDFRSIVDAIR